MKKIVLLALATLLSMGSFAQQTFGFKGTVPSELNDKKVYLYDYDAQKSIDSTAIKNGKFEFNLQIDKPSICRVIFEGSRNYDDIFADNALVEVVLGEKGFSSIKSSGGLNAKYAELSDRTIALNARVEVLIDSLQKIYADDQQAIYGELSAQATPMVDAIYDYMEEQLQANSDNIFGVYCVWKLSDERVSNLAQLDSLMAISPASKDFLPLKAKRKDFQLLEATGPGAMFKDFAAKTVDGKPTKLSHYVGKGKYVLVDFWASWCGPCMRELPNLKYLHETYPDLVLLGVNVWDKHDKFLEAIDKKGMTWTSIYASDDNEATESYGIKGIPTIILFAPDGTIVDRTLRGEEMKAFIANIFKK